MRTQKTYSTTIHPDGTVDIGISWNAVQPVTGDFAKYLGEKLYYVELSTTGPDGLFRQLTDGITTYVAPTPIPDVEQVVGWLGVDQVTPIGVFRGTVRLKLNS